jgi:glycerate kinase
LIVKIVIAPDKFKGSLDAPRVARAIAEGIRQVLPDAMIDECPLADGGEGTVVALIAATSGRIERRRVTGPLPEMKIEAAFGVLGDGLTAVIEMAAASGLALLLPDDRNPMNTTSFGTGELLMAAAGLGVKQIILGIGGSATIDGGIGCAQACGLPVILEDGELVSPTEPLTGADVARVVLIKHGRGSPIERVGIIVACDVANPLSGPNGAAAIYGPQKGATPQQVAELDAALAKLARRCGKTSQANAPGAGAAGGLGFAMLAFFGAKLRSGIDIVMHAAHLRERLAGADLCITGEGSLDASSLHGKTPIGVARLCKSLGVPCIALAGRVEEGLSDLREQGLMEWHRIHDGALSPEESMRRAEDLLTRKAAEIIRAWTD